MRIILALVLVMYSATAFAQGNAPTAGEKPPVQVKPRNAATAKDKGKPPSIAGKLKACLEIEDGFVVRFRDEAMTAPEGPRLKVPHMGWSPVHQSRAHPLWEGIPDGTRFYFAHSYYPEPTDPASTAGTADYPVAFTCAIARANIFATQFHPEKSHRAGLQLLANFVTWDGDI